MWISMNISWRFGVGISVSLFGDKFSDLSRVAPSLLTILMLRSPEGWDFRRGPLTSHPPCGILNSTCFQYRLLLLLKKERANL